MQQEQGATHTSAQCDVRLQPGPPGHSRHSRIAWLRRFSFCWLTPYLPIWSGSGGQSHGWNNASLAAAASWIKEGLLLRSEMPRPPP